MCFCRCRQLNALRREALLALEEKLLQGYRRDGAASPEAEKLGCGADKRTRQEERREAEDAGKTVIVFVGEPVSAAGGASFFLCT